MGSAIRLSSIRFAGTAACAPLASVFACWGDFYAVNVSCLDDVTPDELMNAPIRYLDGYNDEWETSPADVGICELARS